MENIIDSDLGRITYKPFWVCSFKALFLLASSNPGQGQPRAKLCCPGVAAEEAEQRRQRQSPLLAEP